MKRLIFILFAMFILHGACFPQNDTIFLTSDTMLIGRVKIGQTYLIAGWYSNTVRERMPKIEKMMKPIADFLKQHDTLYLHITGFANRHLAMDNAEEIAYYKALDGLTSCILPKSMFEMIREKKSKNLIIYEGKDCMEKLDRYYNAPAIAYLTISPLPVSDFVSGEDFPCRNLRFWNSGSFCAYRSEEHTSELQSQTNPVC